MDIGYCIGSLGGLIIIGCVVLAFVDQSLFFEIVFWIWVFIGGFFVGKH